MVFNVKNSGTASAKIGFSLLGIKDHKESIKEQIEIYNAAAIELKAAEAELSKCTEGTDEFKEATKQVEKAQTNFNNAIKTDSKSLKKYFDTLKGGTTSYADYSRNLVTSTLKTVGLTIATAALNATITMGVSLLISGVTYLVEYFTKADERAQEIIEKGEEAAQKIQEIADKIKDLNSLTAEGSGETANAYLNCTVMILIQPDGGKYIIGDKNGENE